MPWAIAVLLGMLFAHGIGCSSARRFARHEANATTGAVAVSVAASEHAFLPLPVGEEPGELTNRTVLLPPKDAGETGVLWTAGFFPNKLEPTCEPCAPGLAASRETVSSRPCSCSLRGKIWSDHKNYYSRQTAGDLFWGVGAGAIFANTSWDQDIRDWYQDDVRSRDTDNFASFWKTFGEGEIFIGAFAGLALAGKLLENRPVGRLTGDFGGRVTRSYLVGAPPMLFMQAMLGGSRPGEDPRYDSRWKPFDDDNAVSGHAFIGSVPFITAAMMSERPLAKGGFYVLSALPAWSRVNDDAHYFSQACLGWWMGYLACRAVNQTETARRDFALLPVTTPDMVGVQAILRR